MITPFGWILIASAVIGVVVVIGLFVHGVSNIGQPEVDYTDDIEALVKRWEASTETWSPGGGQTFGILRICDADGVCDRIITRVSAVGCRVRDVWKHDVATDKLSVFTDDDYCHDFRWSRFFETYPQMRLPRTPMLKISQDEYNQLKAKADAYDRSIAEFDGDVDL